MTPVPADVKQYINSGFAARLERNDPEQLEVLIETTPGQAATVAQQVRNLEGAALGDVGVIGGLYVSAAVTERALFRLARLDSVAFVSQNQTAGVMEQNSVKSLLSTVSLTYNPLTDRASDALYDALSPEDGEVGNVRIGHVEVPRFNFAQLPPGDPVKLAQTVMSQVSSEGTGGEKLIPTTEAVQWLRDGSVTDGVDSNTSKVGIIDTGHTPTEPENGFRVPKLESFVPGEPPLDMMGHGSWCTNMVVGNASPGVWGYSAGVAPNSIYGHFKALNTFPGFGKTSWILKAMNAALEWGADVISMSLGGQQQGRVGEDPYTRFIESNCKENAGDEDGAIFVVAAGNAGADGYTIGSPGVSPKALTVGSWSLSDNSPAIFSSRGPQGAHYKDNQEQFQEDLSEFGADEFVKPDVVAPGGGRENAAKTDDADELLFQTSTGWYDGLRDGVKDGRANMKGTSMATPAVAGLVKRLYDAGIVTTAADVKQVVSERGGVAEYPDAAPGANETVEGKNIAAGFGVIRESLFEPDTE